MQGKSWCKRQLKHLRVEFRRSNIGLRGEVEHTYGSSRIWTDTGRVGVTLQAGKEVQVWSMVSRGEVCMLWPWGEWNDGCKWIVLIQAGILQLTHTLYSSYWHHRTIDYQKWGLPTKIVFAFWYGSFMSYGGSQVPRDSHLSAVHSHLAPRLVSGTKLLQMRGWYVPSEMKLCSFVVHLLSLGLLAQGKSQPPCHKSSREGHTQWGTEAPSQVTWVTLAGDPKSPGQPSDDQSPGRHLDANPTGDPESERPSDTAPGFLIFRNCWSVFSVFSYWVLGLFC